MNVDEEVFAGWPGRPLKCEINVLSKPEGSALLSQGNTVVMASLFGPHEIKHGKIQTDETTAFQLTYKTKVGPPSNEAKSKEDLIKSACESVLFPKHFARHELTMVVQEFQNTGSILSCAINAGCLAMINSGIEMRYLVVAVTASLDSDGGIVVDPDDAQLKNVKVVMDVAFDTVDYNVVMVNSEGTCSSEEYRLLLSRCREAAQVLTEYFRSIVKKYSVVLQ